jgi:hypothetical protein
MLYGRYGRDAIYIMQEFFRRLGLSQESITHERLKEIRRFLNSMPSYHPVKHRMELFRNYDVSDNETVDLFLHPSDRAYTISEIYKYLADNGMVMQRLINRAHYAPSCSGLVDSPYYPRIRTLPDTEQLALGELYRASAIMHEFIACPVERPRESWEIRFDGDNWKRLVPVKNPMVNSDPNNLPPGIVTKLHLSGHLYKDIFLNLDKNRITITEYIDGKRTLEEIDRELDMQAGIDISREQLVEFISLMLDYDYIWFRKKPLTQ